MKTKLILSSMALGLAALSGACGSSPANSNANSNVKPASTPANIAVVPATPANAMPAHAAGNGNANSALRKPPVTGVNSSGKVDPRTALTDDDVPANTPKKK